MTHPEAHEHPKHGLRRALEHHQRATAAMVDAARELRTVLERVDTPDAGQTEQAGGDAAHPAG